MSRSGRSGYVSPSRRGRFYSRSISKSRSRSGSPDSSDVENPGNSLYVTGLSPRVTKVDLEKHFSKEGEMVDIHLVMDPWKRENRGFGFVTMATLEDANRCIKYLDGSLLGGRVITVEKSRRRRGRTPTPGRYLGLKSGAGRGGSGSWSPRGRRGSSRCRSASPGYYSSERERSCSPYYRRHRSRSRSCSPYYRRHRSRSRSYSPCYYRRRDRSRSRSRSYSPYSYKRRNRSRTYSPYDYTRGRSRSYSPPPYYGSHNRSRFPYHTSSRRSYSRSYSPTPRRSMSRSYSPLSSSPSSGRGNGRHSRESYSHSRSRGSRSLSASPSRSS